MEGKYLCDCCGSQRAVVSNQLNVCGSVRHNWAATESLHRVIERTLNKM